MAASPGPDKGAPPREDRFATTHWSVVLQAADLESDDAADALERLCRAYWYPLYTYVRSRGNEVHDAQDLTQAFFAQLLTRNSLAKVDRTKGRFRQFLLGSIKHFLANEWDRSQTLKRGGGVSFLAWDELPEESALLSQVQAGVTGESLYERQWALTLLDQVQARLCDECQRAGKATLFEALQPFLSGDAAGTSYAAVGERLDMSPGAVQVAAHRLRRRYGELLRLEIGHTVSRPEEIDQEIRDLFAALRQ